MVGGAVATIGLGSLSGVGLAQAATDNDASNPESSLIDKLVGRFKLNKDDVQKVFDEEHSAREAKRDAEVKTKLDGLVKAGKLTQDQADKLVAKAAELKTEREANHEAMKDKTGDERKAAMRANRDSLKQWLSDNGIDEQYGRFLMGGRGHGPGGPGGHGPEMRDKTTE